MALQKAPQTAWRPAEEISAPLIDSEGDGLALLRRVRSQYYNRANKLAARITDDYYEGNLDNLREYIERLRLCGDRVSLLIPTEDKHDVEEGNSTDPVRQADIQPAGALCEPTSTQQEGQGVPEEASQKDPNANLGHDLDHAVGLGEHEETTHHQEPGAGVPGESQDSVQK